MRPFENTLFFLMTEDHEYSEEEDDAIVLASKTTGTADEALMTMLKDLRKKKLKSMEYLLLLFFKTLL